MPSSTQVPVRVPTQIAENGATDAKNCFGSRSVTSERPGADEIQTKQDNYGESDEESKADECLLNAESRDERPRCWPSCGGKRRSGWTVFYRRRHFSERIALDAFGGVLSRLCRFPKITNNPGTIWVATLSGVFAGRIGQIGIRSVWLDRPMRADQGRPDTILASPGFGARFASPVARQ